MFPNFSVSTRDTVTSFEISSAYGFIFFHAFKHFI
nr:MAG TPA: hypothetical protein [Caudoviricetes sp.]